MKIALLGYGKMGKTIEKIALERGHTIVLKVDKDDTNYDLSEADVAIDFSLPSTAVAASKWVRWGKALASVANSITAEW